MSVEGLVSNSLEDRASTKNLAEQTYRGTFFFMGWDPHFPMKHPATCDSVAICRFKKKLCLKISRSAPVCGTNENRIKREQLNENTAFIDASPLYGSSSKDLHKFRDGTTGFLKMSRFNNQMVLPFDQSKCASKSSCKATFTAGDIRVNLFIGLSSMHILFTREHNRIATALHRLNQHWSGDRIFQETRKIVGAEVQNIVYEEFLPKILGNSMSVHIGPYEGYKPDVDPTISNVFTTAAYRFGHGMLQVE
ncbi:unnamed protein product [Anisakis simplex]|uniref:Peroxidase mlt-7 (inferred by orthology to a C. elegans protein) n=1 Tax=Anisakis simplex TaxID=6269 RepID=A0A0M3KBK7_ANISI|nr:unnamed protein product [Anisakis simplex]